MSPEARSSEISSRAFVDSVADVADVAAMAALVDEYYEIGRIVAVDPLTSGTVNASFLVATEYGHGLEERREYVARCYRRGRSEQRVRYEHDLLEYMERKGVSGIAAPIRSRDGATFVRCRFADGGKGEHGARFVAVFPRLAGEDRYGWDRPGCGKAELASAATVLAKYHSAVSGWSVGSAPSMPTVAEEVESALVSNHGALRCSKLERHYGSEREHVRRHARDVLDRTASGAHARMPRLVIHRDFHPGNCLWAAEGVVGLLDFDWADLDLRGLDVALAAVYFCAIWSDQPQVADWPPADADTLCLERLATFVSTYQRKTSVPTPGPLEARERDSMPTLISLANLFVLAWVVGAAPGERSEQDSLRHLEHHLRLVDWIAANQEPLRDTFWRTYR